MISKKEFMLRVLVIVIGSISTAIIAGVLMYHYVYDSILLAIVFGLAVSWLYGKFISVPLVKKMLKGGVKVTAEEAGMLKKEIEKEKQKKKSDSDK